ncbi:MAG: hypothetical protein CMG60_00400 [Candidatus Marinimicrobia bacterium]|nr:hypothetical protein [Candidatus Neomarinimicrobiota bacterium]
MFRLIKFFLVYIFICFNSIVFPSQPLYYEDRVMVYVDNKIMDFQILNDLKRTTLPDFNKILNNYDVHLIEKWLPKARPTDRDGNIYLNRYYVIKFQNLVNDIGKLINILTELESISFSEKIPIVRPAYVPNDSLWGQLYGLSQIKADLAFDLWDIDNGEIPGQMDSGEVVVAIPDVGFKWDHPDLIDNVWQNLGEDVDGDGVVLEFINNEWVFDPDDVNEIDDDDDGWVDNFVGYDPAMNDNDPYPLRNNHVHGTKVAGNVSAVTNNGIGLASVGYSVKLMGINANDNPNEPWYLTHTPQSVLAAAQMGADVINCSWTHGYSTSTENLFNTVYDQYGCISLGAAGNGVNFGGIDDTTGFNPWWPAAFESVIGVTALGANNTFNCWANVGEHIDIGAPGEYIICAYTYPDTLYALGTGTSYATPLTAGAIALVKSVIPSTDNETIISKVINTADFYPDMERNCVGQSIEGLVGSGQLNIHRAVLACKYPELLPTTINYQTDNGYIAPGDTIIMNITISNSLGFEDAENLVATLSTNAPNFSIIDDQINYESILVGGNEITGQFILTSNDNASLGDIPFNINLVANSGENLYENNVEVWIPLSFGEMYGFPVNNVDVVGSPTITDLDGNSLTEIYFGADSVIIGKWLGGLDVNGFPFNAGSDITTSISAGDLDGDGDKELVFGTSNGIVYALTKTGTLHMSYEQEDSIVDVPVLSDFNQDGDMEIIFISSNDSSSSLYVINDFGENVSGFPIDFSEKIIAAPAVADLDNNMLLDIVIVTLDSNVYVIDANGIMNPAFPISTVGSLRSPATLVDFDGDYYLEIIVINHNGDIYVFDTEGNVMNYFSTGNTGDSINGAGLSVADLDGDGSMEILFAGDDEYLHAWDPIADEEPNGWPLQLTSFHGGASEPITIDIDNDGDLEVMFLKGSDELHLYHHNGESYANFPYSSQYDITFTPAIGHLDNDGDYEIIVGTSTDLRVIDISLEAGIKYSWSSYRGNNHRNGYYDVTLASTISNDISLPVEFSLGNNYPNPFNPITKFRYSLSENSKVNIIIYDINGKIVRTLLDAAELAGHRYITWDAKNDLGFPVATGLYFYRMRAKNFQDTKKMILLK